MTTIARSIGTLAVAAICIALLAAYANGPAADAQPEQAQKAIEAQQHNCILVEAFVVEVKLSSLYEQGVNPIGQRPNSVSVQNLLNCLRNQDAGKVTAGVKLSLRSTANAKAKIAETTYVEQPVAATGSRRSDSPPVARNYRGYDIGEQFDAEASVGPHGEILVDFAFNQSTFRDAASNREIPPNTVNRQWSGTASLAAGEPAIVGASQNEETAAFLVLCAHVGGK